jgi:2-(1,2-epoxy-1,2-dihydrophenyl)acetyl-CoA isomerase
VSEAPLLSRRDGPVVTLTLNRPERLNSLTPDLLGALHAELVAARDDNDIRAVVLTGAGRGFSSGADLGGEGPHDVRAGLSLALACDLRIAAESASFIQAFVRIGLVPDAGGTFFLPRLVGLARAMEMAMLGDKVEARDALAAGLVNRVVPDAEALAAAQALALRLAQGPRSVGLIKRALNLSLGSDLGSQLQHEEDLQALAAASQDFVEGVVAFHERRPARFTGR